MSADDRAAGTGGVAGGADARLGRRAFLRGAAGTAAVAGTGAAQDAPYGGWFSDVDNYGGTVDRRGRSEVTVEVGTQGNGGPFAFTPAAVRIDPGTTVTFEWVSDNHNVVPESQPEGAGWEGHDPIQNTGFSFTTTFDAEGVYLYFCEPHRALGMKAALVVGEERVGEGPVGPPPGEGGDGGGTGGGGGPALSLPSTPVLVGTGLLLAALAPAALGAAWLLRGRGGPVDATDAGTGEAATAAAEPTPGPVETESAALAAVEREVDHESFDPTGTLALVVVYFVILVVMWVFMYFVEFLGGGPTVVG